MRITGLATGLDMDEIVTSSMKPYRIKIDQTTQKRDVVEIKQKLYRDIMSDASKFYDKYFDILKSDGLLNSSNYTSVKFTSDSSLVSVTGNSTAKSCSYTISGTSPTASKAIITMDKFTVSNPDDGYKEIVINEKAYKVLDNKDKTKMAEDLNKQLQEDKVNVKVKYSDMAGTDFGNVSGFIFESTVLGSGGEFTIGAKSTSSSTPLNSDGKDATYAEITGISLDNIKNDKVEIGNNKIELNLTEDEKKDESLVLKKFNDKLNEYNINFKAEIDNSTNKIKLISKEIGSGIDDPEVRSDGDDITFISGEDETKATVNVKLSELKNQLSGLSTFVIDDKIINLNLDSIDKDDINSTVKYLQDVFIANEINVTVFADNNDGIKFESKASGKNSKLKIEIKNGVVYPQSGSDSSVKIKDDKGGVYSVTNEEYTKGSVDIDGIKFKFYGEIPAKGVAVEGKIDVNELKGKIVNFVNDYNTLIEKLNTLTSTKHDRSYMPLTADQKKEMSDEEIKLWNERVEKGQLYKDANLTRITNSMKDIMRTLMDDSGFNLEKIGIKPVGDFGGTKNGTFTIDENELTKALEENVEEAMNLFIRPAPKKPTADELNKMTADEIKEYEKSKKQTGLLIKLKDLINSEFKTSTSALAKKVGLSGTATFSNNELTKSISDYETKMKEMETDFSRREQALYSKYATLETMMNKLNAQQSNLLSQLGMA